MFQNIISVILILAIAYVSILILVRYFKQRKIVKNIEKTAEAKQTTKTPDDSKSTISNNPTQDISMTPNYIKSVHDDQDQTMLNNSSKKHVAFNDNPIYYHLNEESESEYTYTPENKFEPFDNNTSIKKPNNTFDLEFGGSESEYKVEPVDYAEYSGNFYSFRDKTMMNSQMYDTVDAMNDLYLSGNGDISRNNQNKPISELYDNLTGKK